MFTLRIEHNLDEVIEDLKKLEQQIRDLTKFWQLYVLPHLFMEVENIFENVGPASWTPLSPEYAAEKSAIFGPGNWKMLRYTDWLFESYTVRGAAGSVQDADEDSLVYGTDVPYSHYHEFGGFPPENWGPIPARPVLGLLPDSLEDSLGERLESYLDNMILEFEK